MSAIYVDTHLGCIDVFECSRVSMLRSGLAGGLEAHQGGQSLTKLHSAFSVFLGVSLFEMCFHVQRAWPEWQLVIEATSS